MIVHASLIAAAGSWMLVLLYLMLFFLLNLSVFAVVVGVLVIFYALIYLMFVCISVLPLVL